MNNHIVNQNMPTPGNDFLWIIEAPLYYLDKYCLTAGLPRDSAVPVVFKINQNRFDDARLTYPGTKCPHHRPWLKVLANLYVGNIAFKLYQGTGCEDCLTSLTLLHPTISKDLHLILGFTAQNEIQRLEKYDHLLKKAFSLLY